MLQILKRRLGSWTRSLDYFHSFFKYYVGADYIDRVSATQAAAGDKIAVIQMNDGTSTLVVIYSKEFLDSYKDGQLYYGNIDGNWGARP